jgi:hypothetical protein
MGGSHIINTVIRGCAYRSSTAVAFAGEGGVSEEMHLSRLTQTLPLRLRLRLLLVGVAIT